MKHVLDRWLSSIDRNRLQRPAMFAAGLALAVGTVGGPAAIQAANEPASAAAPVTATVAGNGDGTAKPVHDSTKKDDAKKATPKKAAQVRFGYQEQSTYYFCAPAATRIALSATGHALSQEDLAGKLGTTVNGTDSAHETTRVLNDVNGTDFYRTREIPGPAAKPAEMDRLQADAVRALGNGYPIVANIKGTAVDVDGKAHSYEGGHYLTVVGYRDEGRTLQIADPYDTSNGGTYWMTTISVANWIAERGYSA
ncbi:C39 family peptidase [Phytohabitans sp. ZYX-F-186]|uniref:C39 family peptidase n=1 Tax=Phytohabitans maris TaxID=3071409 RepID=A0ABU0ZBT5_9ACTN|nr:C39 family peptidase [Phytohabitans sp. ZYX-F-186]MDQ7904510.1 C39 family peptidase [Phytohabitans sp. ZYX-F-186]